MSETKQIIVARGDLNYGSRGKFAAQVAHASIAFLTNRLYFDPDWYSEGSFTEAECDWINGIFKKIVLRVDSEQELLDIHEEAQDANLSSFLITDRGLTVFGEPTNTCVGIGPDWSELIDPVCGHLRPF